MMNNESVKLSLTVVILSFNEAKHIGRCIKNIQEVAERIILVDSYSTDDTVEIASSLGAEIYQNPFTHQAQQIQWALDNIDIQTDWVMRMDADEYILPELAKELKIKIPVLPDTISGLLIKLRVIFLDKWIKRGFYPMILLRIWRNGAAYIQQKWMDEHTILKYGHTMMLEHDMVDHNLNHLGWWTEKHNRYSLREATERLNLEYGFLGDQYDTAYKIGNKKKWYKSLYMRLPLFVRPFLYFLYRYIIRLGFLEGKPGLIWHVLQGFWFQFLVDAKIYQIRHIARKTGKSVKEVLTDDFGVKL
ncbi:MAG: glycosyltransferase family 2 protein [Saprospiraceae bacterium]|nr:glycosyltransferase family 2 protein [Saprospiraceae bacterium]